MMLPYETPLWFYLRYGRRIMLLVSYVFATLFGMGSAFSVNYVMFAVMRFFTGFSITGIIIVTSVLSEYDTLYALPHKSMSPLLLLKRISDHARRVTVGNTTR